MQANKNTDEQVRQLFGVRNQYGPGFNTQKKSVLQSIEPQQIRNTKTLIEYYDILLFLLVYPDDKKVYELASNALQQLETYINGHVKVQERLYNSGVTGSNICAAFGFEIAKWLRERYGKNLMLESIEADEGQITYILSVVMAQVESEIMQDANADWKHWLKNLQLHGQDMLDMLVAVFAETDVRPEVKDELWNALGINIIIRTTDNCALPKGLFDTYYHNSLIRNVTYPVTRDEEAVEPVKVKISTQEAEQIIDCGRMILLRHVREIDPVTFTAPEFVAYYKMERGITIALMGMPPERRHPVDSYMGYVVFKNGLPVAYAGSWILFDSGRIGLNVFPSFRGGESLYIFKQVLEVHRKVYRLKRFSVDPYQIGKDNSDGIKSGAFWVYYHMGFRPVRAEQKKIAEEESVKRSAQKSYRSPYAALKQLANSRMELVMGGKPVRFDVTDLSIAYINILKDRFNNSRKQAMDYAYPRIVRLLKLEKAYTDMNLEFVVKNWCVFLITAEDELKSNKALCATLAEILLMKANGSEEKYIYGLQRLKEVRAIFEAIKMER
jgi:hypothetical protein